MIGFEKIYETWKKEEGRYDIHHDPILDSDGYNRNRGHTCLIYKDRIPIKKFATDDEAQAYIDKNCAQAVAELFKTATKQNYDSAYHQRCSIKPKL